MSKKHWSAVALILMLLFVATATSNNSHNTTSNSFPRKTKTSKELDLEVYRNGRLLFITTLTPEVEIDLIAKAQNGFFLAHYRGETFHIHTSSTTDVFIPTETSADNSQSDLDKTVEVEWAIGSTSYKNPKVLKTFPKSVMIRHDDGVAFIERDQIPKNENGDSTNQTYHLIQRGDKRTTRSECNGSTTWLKLETFMNLPTDSVSKNANLWQVEQKILNQEHQNRDLGEICRYKYVGLAELIKESSTQNTKEHDSISIEDEFRKKGIRAKQQEPRGCGVAALSTALEFLLKKETPNIEVPWAKTKGLVLKYPDARGRIGFAYSMGPEIISSFGIPTNQGIQRRPIKVRGLYKFFILNRDEAPDEKLNNNPLSFQTQVVERLIINELRNKRPILAGTTSGPIDTKRDSIGPNFGKNEYPHAVVIVGYERLAGADSPYRLRILNSWGEKWGQDGYGWLYPSKITGLYSIEIL